ncbi:MAG: dicarboxylate/amino acid:cation symporter [Saprospiraceae bacterium]
MSIKLNLTTQIVLALVIGVLVGIGANIFEFSTFIECWIAPFGKLFINALKFIAVPLIVISLLNGFASLTDVSKLGKIARSTVIFYLGTTILAVGLGILLTNVFQPGSYIGEAVREQLLNSQNGNSASEAITSPLQFLVNLIPSLGKVNMISLIFVTLIAAIAVIRLPDATQSTLQSLFVALNDWVIKIIDFIMRYLGPIGVFALMATVVARTESIDFLGVLLLYCAVVIGGFIVLVFGIYPFLAKAVAGISYQQFLKGILPAQLVALTTSSSAATLSVTMQCTEENLQVRKEVSGFVLPLGATANMDGTALYQGVICLFIAQVYGIELSIIDQLIIIGTVTISSIGSAAVPSGGIVMLALVLEQVGLPAAGLGLVIALDRPLDMLRTVVNITGDAAVATGVDRLVK